MVVLLDKNGISKTIARGLDTENKDAIVKMLQADNLQEFKGQVSLPVWVKLKNKWHIKLTII